MLTINLEDGREAPSKAGKKGAKRLEFLVNNNTIKNDMFRAAGKGYEAEAFYPNTKFVFKVSIYLYM